MRCHCGAIARFLDLVPAKTDAVDLKTTERFYSKLSASSFWSVQVAQSLVFVTNVSFPQSVVSVVSGISAVVFPSVEFLLLKLHSVVYAAGQPPNFISGISALTVANGQSLVVVPDMQMPAVSWRKTFP